MTSYTQTLLESLGRYRCNVLKIKEPGVFNRKGKEHLKEHILPIGERKLNFLPHIRESASKLTDAIGVGIKWHRYAHHLNSSQILAVNLFHPLIQAGEDGWRILAEITETVFPFQPPTCFEFVPDKKEGTNIDFCVTGADEARVFMELKLTEQGFGSPKDDQHHRDKFREFYSPLCRGKINLPDGAEWATFRRYYQIFRNVLYADQFTRVWFVIPKPHTTLLKKLDLALEFVDPAIRSQIRVVHLGELFRKIEQRVSSEPELSEHYTSFSQKYGPALI